VRDILTEFYILNLLASQQGRVRSYDELKGITRQRYVETNTVTGHIRRIRRKFQKIDPSFTALKSVHGVGVPPPADGVSVAGLMPYEETGSRDAGTLTGLPSLPMTAY